MKRMHADTGAHIGIFTVKAAKAVGPNGRVIAVEPCENNLAFLEKNVKENELQNVTIVKKGLWSSGGKMNLYLSGKQFGDVTLVYRRENSIEVDVDTIDNILFELGIEKIDFIKMDIEGAEIEALKGAEDTLKANNVKLAIAAYHQLNEEPTYKIIIPFLRERDFKIVRKGDMIYAQKS